MDVKSLCIRCGRERVTVKTWKEKVGESLSIHSLNVCPDSTCQKIVDAELKARRVKSDLIEKKRFEAKAERIKAAAALKLK